MLTFEDSRGDAHVSRLGHKGMLSFEDAGTRAQEQEQGKSKFVTSARARARARARQEQVQEQAMGQVHVPADGPVGRVAIYRNNV